MRKTPKDPSIANDSLYRFVGDPVGIAVGPRNGGYEARLNLPNRKVHIWRATKLDAIRSARRYLDKVKEITSIPTEIG